MPQPTTDSRPDPGAVATAAQKLHVEDGTAVWMSHPERIVQLEPWPARTSQVGDPAVAGVALVFADDAAMLRDGLDRLLPAHTDGTPIWIVLDGAESAATPVLDALDATGLKGTEEVILDERRRAVRVERDGVPSA